MKLKICLIVTLISIFSGCTTLYSNECGWYKPVQLSEADKAVLSRDGKEQIARNNINYDKLCED